MSEYRYYPDAEIDFALSVIVDGRKRLESFIQMSYECLREINLAQRCIQRRANEIIKGLGGDDER